MSNKLIAKILLFLMCFLIVVFNGRTLKSYEFNKQNSKLLEELPPSLQVTSVALGPMKGLLADVVWWRAERMLENKEFFESIQLADWLTGLQPTYPSVWVYQGFNLAFNISYNFSNVEERWKWIHEGIKLLRDKGLRSIPDWELNRKIRFEIVDIYSRKLSGVSDVEARRFQDFWTLEMLKYFDQGSLSELEKIAKAPKTFVELMQDKDVVEFFDVLKLSESKFETMLIMQPPSLKLLKANTPENKTYNSTFMKVYRYSQRKRLKAELNMDIERIIQVDNEYGPLDWRTHEAQIIYWGMEEDHSKFKSGGMQYSHYIRDALLSSLYRGRILFSEEKDYFMRTQNLEMVIRLHEYFNKALSELEYGTVDFARADKMNRDFLQRASVICYNYNQISAAKDLFNHYADYLKEDGKEMTFEQFIVQSMETSLKRENYKSRGSFLESVITKALEDAALGEWDRYHGYTRLVKMIYKMHQKKHADAPARLLPPLKDIVASAKKSYAKKKNKNDDELSKLEQEADKYAEPEVELLKSFHCKDEGNELNSSQK